LKKGQDPKRPNKLRILKLFSFTYAENQSGSARNKNYFIDEEYPNLGGRPGVERTEVVDADSFEGARWGRAKVRQRCLVAPKRSGVGSAALDAPC